MHNLTKEQLFERWFIKSPFAKEWDDVIDNWYSVEVFRFMNDGRLPTEKDTTWQYLIDFMEKKRDKAWLIDQMFMVPNWGSISLTASRLVYRHADLILVEFNQALAGNEGEK